MLIFYEKIYLLIAGVQILKRWMVQLDYMLNVNNNFLALILKLVFTC